jgi:hypothetical protein
LAVSVSILVSSARLVSGSKKPPQLGGSRGQVVVFLSQFFDHRFILICGSNESVTLEPAIVGISLGNTKIEFYHEAAQPSYKRMQTRIHVAMSKDAMHSGTPGSPHEPLRAT